MHIIKRIVIILKNLLEFFAGFDYIKLQTRQSIQTKPFCLAVGKEWTLRQSEFRHEDTYTELHFQMKYRKPTWTEKKPLGNIFTLFEDKTLRRLLIEGVIQRKMYIHMRSKIS